MRPSESSPEKVLLRVEAILLSSSWCKCRAGNATARSLREREDSSMTVVVSDGLSWGAGTLATCSGVSVIVGVPAEKVGVALVVALVAVFMAVR